MKSIQLAPANRLGTMAGHYQHYRGARRMSQEQLPRVVAETFGRNGTFWQYQKIAWDWFPRKIPGNPIGNPGFPMANFMKFGIDNLQERLPSVPQYPPPNIPIPSFDWPDIPELPGWPPLRIPTPPRDPLVIDLNMDGVTFTPLGAPVVTFDIDSDGHRERVGWVSPSDGLLVRDLNGNGQVDNLSELVGESARDGFAVLTAFDLDDNGTIDARDQIFSSLLVWQDLNSDGFSSTNELRSLSSWGIVSIDITPDSVQQTRAGSLISHISTVTWGNGQASEIVAAWFSIDQLLSVYEPTATDTLNLRSGFLPILWGYGDLKPLFLAASENAALQAQAEALVASRWTLSTDQLSASFNDLLFAWSGVSNLSTEARGIHLDARELAFLERLYGQPLAGATLSQNDGRFFHDTFATVRDAWLARFLVQAGGSSIALASDPAAALAQIQIEDVAVQAIAIDFGPDKLAFSAQQFFERSAILLDVSGGPDFALALARVEKLMNFAAMLRSDLASGSLETLRNLLVPETDGDYAKSFGTIFSAFIEGGSLLAEGSSSATTISGSADAEIIYGGRGNDTLSGNDGSDTYIFVAGDGVDRIEDNGFRDNDRLVIHGHAVAGVSLTRTGANLSLRFAGSTDAITIVNTLEGDYSDTIEQILFDDGTRWTVEYLQNRFVSEQQTAGNDTIIGFHSRDDVLTGGRGNDILHGQDGSDTYIFNTGDGIDRIEDNGFRDDDRLLIHGHAASGVTLTRAGVDFTMRFAGSNDAITIVNMLEGNLDDIIEQIVFDDGTIWGLEYLQNRLIAVQQTSGNDIITGFHSRDDVLTGGRGNDTVSGQDGSDTYIFSAGDGIDRIEDNGFRDEDRLLIHGHAASGVTLTRAGVDFTMRFAGSNDAITIVNMLEGNLDDIIEQIVFDDGTIWGLEYLQNRFIAVQQTSGNDTITGFHSRDDILIGGRGNDTVSGQDGSDTYIFNAGDGIDRIEDNGFRDEDLLLIHGHAASGVTLTRAGVDFTMRFAGSNDAITIVNMLEGNLDDIIEQIVFDDGTIWGLEYLQNRFIAVQQTSGNDIIAGFHSRDDVLTGGRGNDTVSGQDGSDTYIFNAGDGIDRIEDNGFRDNDRLLIRGHAAASVTVTRAGNDLTLRFAGSSDAITIVNTIDGNLDDHIEEILFDDGTMWNSLYVQYLLNGTPPSGLILGSAAGELLFGTTGNDSIYAQDGNDTAWGGTGDDQMVGGAGADILGGDAGADKIAGGSGNDTIYGGADNDDLRGGDDADFILGDSGHDLVSGDRGDDRLFGFDGDDRLDGGEGNDELNGESGWDELFGGSGNDLLDGGIRADVMTGGAGDDRFLVDQADDRVIEQAGEGNDRVFASVSYTLAAGVSVERLTTNANTGTAAINLTGNELANQIYGNAGANILDGKAGADFLAGLQGDDWFHIDNAADIVSELAGEGNDRVFSSVSYILAAGASVEKLTTSSNAGTAAINLTGNELANQIYGNAGANILDGKAGGDFLAGLQGDDWFHVDNAADIVSELAGEGNDRVFASVSYILAAGASVEKLTTSSNTGTAAINLTGNELANQIYGNAGANILDGKAGADFMAGMQGDDRFHVDHAADLVSELAGEGNDRVLASVSYTLAAGVSVETLTTSANGDTAAINLTGNELANALYGNAGANILDGKAGADFMAGLLGNDFFYVDNAADQVFEQAGEGSDRVFASVSYQLGTGMSVEQLTTTSNSGTTAIDLTGNELANAIYGNAGANVLNGRLGADFLMGMAGADSFAFTTALGAGNVDTIFDFSSVDDTIRLDDAVFTAIGPLGALNPNAFHTGAAAADMNDRIVYNSSTGELFYDADGNGAGAAVLFATLTGTPNLTASDFVVI